MASSANFLLLLLFLIVPFLFIFLFFFHVLLMNLSHFSKEALNKLSHPKQQMVEM